MKIVEKIMRIIIIIVVIVGVFIFQIPYNVEIDPSEAEEVLREVYMPLEEFVKAGILVKDKGLLKAPLEVENRSNFIKLFDNKMQNKMSEDIFENLFIEKENQLYIDKEIYIPTLYSKNSIITKSYIKKERIVYIHIYLEEVIIKKRSL